jgi:Golgi nucleoside diphosphatase
MIDAGSTGTRAFLYTWDNSFEIPNVHSFTENLELDIPLADDAKDRSVVPSIFGKIIDFSKDKIPEKFVEKTRLFVFATAGMRLLPNKEQNAVLNHVYDYLQENSPFKLKRRYLRVISGVEEGVFGWISVNHLLKVFDDDKETIGALDMGGASMQIAFQVPDDFSGDSIHTVIIGSKMINVFAHSYLGYGVNQALFKINNAISSVLDKDNK